MRRNRLFSIATFLLLTMPAMLCAAPTTIRIQGRLTDNSGAPIVTGASSGRIVVKLYGSQTGVDLLWESPGEIEVDTNSAGLFAKDIGPIDSSVFGAQPEIFLELRVRDTGGLKTLLPRQKLATVPFSVRAESAGAADTAVLADSVAPNSIGSEHIRPQSIDTQHLKVGAVTSVILASATVNTVHLAAQSVTTEKLAPNAVTGSILASDAVATTHLAAGGVTNEKILSVAASKITGQITSAQIAPEALSTVHLATGSVTSAILAPGSVQTIHLASQAVTTEKLAPNAVTSAILAPTAITPIHLAPNLVTTDKILSLSTSKLTGQITGNQIAPESITTTHMATGSVTGLILASATVGSGHILANAVSDIKISDVSAAKITGQLTNDQLAPIAATKITGPITTGQIGDGQVTNAKIATLSASKLSGPLELGVLSALSSLKFGGFETLKILQVQIYTSNTQSSILSTSFSDTSLRGGFTPKRNTSKVLLIAAGDMTQEAGDISYATIARNGGNLAPDNGGFHGTRQNNNYYITMIAYDSPSTTNQVTYSVQLRTQGSGGFARFPVTAGAFTPAAVLIAIEVAQ